MDIKNIKKVIELMKENDLSEFELSEEGFRITIRRPYGSASPQVMYTQAPGGMMPMAPPPMAAPAASAGGTAPSGAPAADDNAGLLEIKSPMVGTFYRAPSPESDAYVNVGSEVEDESVVCIIEAMKVMNEIKSEVKGTIKKILVENATSVEFGQPLFLVDPN